MEGLAQRAVKLNPCPFCGESENVEHGLHWIGVYMIYCKNCGAIVSFDEKINKDACNGWNRRTLDGTKL